MSSDYTELFQDTTTVDEYDQQMCPSDSYSSAISRRQLRYLRRLVGRSFPVRRPVQHDFACGTGRAIRMLHGLVRTAHGYDTSSAMLDRARQIGMRATLHRVDAHGPVPAPAHASRPAIVTVFRLLLNADTTVRDRAIAFAAKALPRWESGLLVVENHGNRRSLRHLQHRRRAGEPWFAELSHPEVTMLLARYGFTVVERRGFALLPRGWYGHWMLRPLARVADELTARVPMLSRYAVNVLYVARRMRPDLLAGVSPRRPADPAR